MFAWVKDYFMKDDDFKPPVYLQHHGMLIYLRYISFLENHDCQGSLHQISTRKPLNKQHIKTDEFGCCLEVSTIDR